MPESPDRHEPVSRRARRIAVEAVLAALIVASGRFHVIPSVEWVSVLCLAAGLLRGVGGGLRVAVAGMLLYSLTSPYGLASPLVLAAQVLGMAPAGLAGGLLRRGTPAFWVYGAAGFLTTLWFDLWTNLATAQYVGALGPSLAAALPFTAVHVASNVVLFAALGPLLRSRLSPLFSSAR
ncbi:MAG: hypothetical protein HZB25_00275 [Candidatus Eisenbacteria bacterium]|nr:hypothetical protein [Candidatus Eisenbacteria bacterium]